MNGRPLTPGVIFAAWFLSALLCLSCAGLSSGRAGTESGEDKAGADVVPVSGENTVSLPGDVRFAGASLPVLRAAAGVGFLARPQGEPEADPGGADRGRLTASFRNTYIDGLSRDIPLAGVLGGDQVHPWPEASPVTRVQNWRSAVSRPNSWGIPSLILAAEDPDSRRVFIVQGAILNVYGKSSGIAGANGAVGYGSPKGEEFFYQGGIAQRFDHGLITVDAAGTARFIPEEAPAAGVPVGTGEFSDPDIMEAFRSAWKTQNLPSLEADTPVNHIDFSARPWVLSGGRDEVSEEGPASLPVRGIYYQSFGKGRVLFILVDAQDIPPHPRTLTSPFLEALLAAASGLIPGAQDLIPDPLPEEYEANTLARKLLNGISFYGVPLSGVLALEDENAPGWHEAQRFSRGWMIAGESGF
jgi:hypothetical protein